MKRFYFVFGSDPEFPYQNGYLVVCAKNINDALTEFRRHYPDKAFNCPNCQAVYDQNEWSTFGCVYAGQEPFAVMYAKEAAAQ